MEKIPVAPDLNESLELRRRIYESELEHVNEGIKKFNDLVNGFSSGYLNMPSEVSQNKILDLSKDTLASLLETKKNLEASLAEIDLVKVKLNNILFSGKKEIEMDVN